MSEKRTPKHVAVEAMDESPSWRESSIPNVAIGCDSTSWQIYYLSTPLDAVPIATTCTVKRSASGEPVAVVGSREREASEIVEPHAMSVAELAADRLSGKQCQTRGEFCLIADLVELGGLTPPAPTDYAQRLWRDAEALEHEQQYRRNEMARTSRLMAQQAMPRLMLDENGQQIRETESRFAPYGTTRVDPDGTKWTAGGDGSWWRAAHESSQPQHTGLATPQPRTPFGAPQPKLTPQQLLAAAVANK